MPMPRRVVEFQGQQVEWAELCRDHKIDPSTVRHRMSRGWTLEQAIAERPDARFQPRPLRRAPIIARAPRLRDHKDGTSYVRYTLNGERVFRRLGPTGEESTRRAYDRFCYEWASQQPAITLGPLTGGATVEQLVAANAQHLRPSLNAKAVSKLACAVRPLLDLYGDLAVRDMTGPRLKALQQRMAGTPSEKGGPVSRATLNERIKTVVRVFAWGCSENLVPSDVLSVLREVPTIKARQHGFTHLKRSRNIKPVPLRDLMLSVRKMRPPYRDATLVQFLMGARSGEVCAMRGADLDGTREVWSYTVPEESSKVAKHGVDLRYYCSPGCRKILERRLTAAGDGFLFASQRKGAGQHITVQALLNEARRAAKLAGVPHWHPHQVRHLRISIVRERYGKEAARAFVAHQSYEMTNNYSDRSRKIAERVAAGKFRPKKKRRAG